MNETSNGSQDLFPATGYSDRILPDDVPEELRWIVEQQTEDIVPPDATPEQITVSWSVAVGALQFRLANRRAEIELTRRAI